MTRKRQLKPLLHRSVDELVRSGVYAFLHDVLAGIEVLVTSYVALLPQTRTSNPFSKILRPLMEHKRIRAVFGANLAGALILVGTVSTPMPIEGAASEVDILTTPEAVVTTEHRFQLPVAQLTGLSQGFSAFHRGMDLRAPFGTGVKPVANGRIVEIVTGRFGYGHYVVLEHEGGMSSLYAHLDKITVAVGEEVTQETLIGTVGLTGWTTGPHLHLEIYDKGVAINPVAVVPTTE